AFPLAPPSSPASPTLLSQNMMNSGKPAESRDPLGLRADLREALALPELERPDTEPGRRAAYQLAAALGRWRRFGVAAGAEDGTLPVPLAVGALEQWFLYAQEWQSLARDLPERWLAASTRIEADSLCLDLLEARMETWAVFVAADEAYEDSLFTGNSARQNLA